ncbi:hypothetical protein SCNU_14194 [Gordonia neofelifaecis NRRL B-59395]|uniref:Uncharacterized protein n=1 Tax=Gordonia neofelifaecis NRRL B-59395 TaxID=644548 RepID=F1YLP5_9ACTN|nr:hypothetical protein SCNU_14194 [Gordonia neofelifaecis NRRL B-59395]
MLRAADLEEVSDGAGFDDADAAAGVRLVVGALAVLDRVELLEAVDDVDVVVGTVLNGRLMVSK